ncbi:D-serine deaminase-like pyridoxal phosphate-dependent protein [Mumia flava]|uniref:D-serine deaminase-like pyridoxal phosphate-dependent protein n=2 Tax=Mumia flava TaxID=1348852 RepID=A0A0B2BP58_9ACTN|nr:D-serine deaminase-like pyridoxal phosphate-dependent protein [Mumia flava]
MERLDRLTRGLEAPYAVVDGAALAHNTTELVRRSGGVGVRVASKSVRVREIIARTLAQDGFGGVMSYSLAESVWLADHGVGDLLLAYPTADRTALADLVAKEHRLAAITLMVDSLDHLDLIDAAVGTDHPPIRLCLDIDSSLKLGPVHVGVRRSPVHDPDEAVALARAIAARPGFDLVGLMFYDAQVAGLQDSSPLVRLAKSRSVEDIVARRAAIVDGVRSVTDLQIVNAAGTGSLETMSADPYVTEVTAGSGLFMPTLFDSYDAFTATPAAFYALSVVRKPTPDIATLYSGGYAASGAAGKDRLPTPVWPRGLSLIGTEGAGEVQTPVRGRVARGLRVGDRVFMRHAKAGEMCERFDAVHLVGTDGTVETLPTYRGEGKNFG